MIDTSTNRSTGSFSLDATIAIKQHVVAVVDILGQSDELSKWHEVMLKDEWDDDSKTVFKNTIGRLYEFRKHFCEAFNEHQEWLTTNSNAISSLMPTVEREEYLRYRNTPIFNCSFSDTIVFYSPVINEDKHLQVSNVAGMISACAAMMHHCLDNKFVFRGAIDVGHLVEMRQVENKGYFEPYGPALAEAHRLESRCAAYPRVVIGNGLMSYLSFLTNKNAVNPYDKANKIIAELCLGSLIKDDDGLYMVDYLGRTFADLLDNKADWDRMVGACRNFVESQLNHFTEQGNIKLIERYQKMLRYCKRMQSSTL